MCFAGCKAGPQADRVLPAGEWGELRNPHQGRPQRSDLRQAAAGFRCGGHHRRPHLEVCAGFIIVPFQAVTAVIEIHNKHN